jgi:ferredoxin-NADP reductase
MLSMFAASPPSNDKAMVLFLGVRDREEFLYGQWLLSLHNRLSQFQLFVCYSKETAIDLQPYERHGYVTDVVAQEHPNPQTDFFMLCGNPQMVDDVFLLLKNLGFSGRNVRREKYVFARQENNSARPKTLSKGDRALLLEKIKRYQE